MSILEGEKTRRLVLCQSMVEIMRPGLICSIRTSCNERIVTYAVGVSTYGPHYMGLNKIAELTGLPRSTARAALNQICDRGWAEKRPDRTYQLTATLDFPAVAAVKSQAIRRAARVLAPSTAGGSNSDPNAMDR